MAEMVVRAEEAYRQFLLLFRLTAKASRGRSEMIIDSPTLYPVLNAPFQPVHESLVTLLAAPCATSNATPACIMFCFKIRPTCFFHQVSEYDNILQIGLAG